MSKPPLDLETPVLLVAMPQVLDPYFHRSVILLIHHDSEGSFGFIANRPTGIRVAEILKGMDIPWEGAADAMAYFGGPVQPQLGSVLCSLGDGDALKLEEFQGTALAPGLTVTQHIGDLQRLSALVPDPFRLFLGYAGWGEGQLLEEILRNDWLTVPVSPELVFARDPDAVWGDALRSVGVDPASLPTWTAGGGAAN
jgi:putative transcriptional regulator